MTMTAITWITMIGVLTFVWGGCGMWITIAMRKEAEKAAGASEESA